MRDAVKSISEIQWDYTDGRARQICLRNDVSQHRTTSSMDLPGTEQYWLEFSCPSTGIRRRAIILANIL